MTRQSTKDFFKEYFSKTVNRYTRAGKNGKEIICPHCNKISRVYHFSWSAVGCLNCKEMVNKNEWRIAS